MKVGSEKLSFEVSKITRAGGGGGGGPDGFPMSKQRQMVVFRMASLSHCDTFIHILYILLVAHAGFISEY